MAIRSRVPNHSWIDGSSATLGAHTRRSGPVPKCATASSMLFSHSAWGMPGQSGASTMRGKVP